MFRKLFLFFLLTICVTLVTEAEIHRFKPAAGTQTYAVREPVLRVKPGDVIESSTMFSNYFTEADGAWPGEVGPIYVENATPADILVVKIIKIHPNIGTGRSGTSSIYGSLTATTTTPMLNEPIPMKRVISSIMAVPLCVYHRFLLSTQK